MKGIYVCVFWIITSLVDCWNDDKVALIYGGAPYKGLVQVTHNGRTGLVCDDEFTTEAGRVVCRQIGYPTTNPRIQVKGRFRYLPWDMHFILDQVRCRGYESRLSDCSHDPWFKHDCVKDETVAVFCDDIICLSRKPCQHGGTCRMLSKTNYQCTCPQDWTGYNCETEVVCLTRRPCQHGGTCSMQHYGYYCTCPGNWTGHDCEIDVDECQQNIHGCSHGCVNTDGGYNCTCPSVQLELSADQRSCYEVICLSRKPCQHGGTCRMLSETSYQCTCPHNWIGHNCEIDVDECQQNHHGCSHECVNTIGGYNCTCPDIELELSSDGHSCIAHGETVTCSSQEMQISFIRDRFPGLHEQYMTLIDPNCHATGNATVISLVSPLNGCGTTSGKVGNNMVYENVVKAREVVIEGVISRVRDISVPFQCVVPVVNHVDVPLDIEFSTLHFAVESEGSYNLRLELFHDENFNKTPEKPFYITPGETLYVQLRLNTTDTTRLPFALNCHATPVKQRSTDVYPVIEEGCPVDDSVKHLPSPTYNIQRFSMEAFKYIDNSPTVYLHCDVIVCNGADNSSRCASGCLMTHPGRRAARDILHDPISIRAKYLRPVPKLQSASFESVVFWAGLTGACAAGTLLIVTIIYNYRLNFFKRKPTLSFY